MSYAVGASLADEETWIRVLVFSDFKLKDGRLHPQAFKAPAFSKARKYAHSFEVSGRVKSLIADIDAEGRAFVDFIRAKQVKNGRIVPESLQYTGHMAGTAQLIRSYSHKHVDVVFSPSARDNAHSDALIFGCNLDELEDFKDHLLKVLIII